MKRLCIIMVILLLSGCNAADQGEKSSKEVEKTPSTETKTIGNLKEGYTFDEFMEDHEVSLKGTDIPYRVEEKFTNQSIALEGKAQLGRYYNYGFYKLEGSHFVIKVTKKDELDWYVYLPREEYPDLFEALKKGPVDVYATVSIPKEYFETGQGHLSIVEEIVFKQSDVEEKPLDDELADYMKEHSVELTARDILYDLKGMSDRPLALSGNAQLVTYRYASAYKDLEPTHFVLSVRDTVNSEEQLWRIVFDRMKYKELYEQALGGMVHVNVTAMVEDDRFTEYAGTNAVGQDVEFKPLERYADTSMEGQSYMEENGLSFIGREVLYDPISYIEEPFFVEGTAEMDPYATASGEYEDLQDTHFRIDIVEDPYGEQYVDYPRALEGWTLYLDRQKYRDIYEKLSQEKYLDVMVTARMPRDRYKMGQGGAALVDNVVIK